MGTAFEVDELIRAAFAGDGKGADRIRVHKIARTHSATGHPLPHAFTGCSVPVDFRDVVPFAPVAPGSVITCKGCAGGGARVTREHPDAELDRIMNMTPGRAWLAGRKGKGVTMHGIIDREPTGTVPVTRGRGKNKTTHDVPVWESACGESVTDWDRDVKTPWIAADGPRTLYAPHETDGGADRIRWCGNCAATYKALRGAPAPKGVLTSRAPENVNDRGETPDRADRANTRAAWAGRVLPLLTLTLGDNGMMPDASHLYVAGTRGPVHVGARDVEGRVMLVCRVGVLGKGETTEPKEGRGISCPGCRDTLYDTDGDAWTFRPGVLRLIMREDTGDDRARFAPAETGWGSELSEHSASLAPAVPATMTVRRPVKLGSGLITHIAHPEPTMRRLSDADAPARRHPFDRRGDNAVFRTGTRKDMREAYAENDRHGMTKMWNKIIFRPTHPDAPAGRRELTMIIHRDTVTELGMIVTGPDGDRVTGWMYLYAMGRLPKRVADRLTREQRARLYGGGASLARKATAERKARKERAEHARAVVTGRTDRLNRYRLDDGTRADGFGNVIYGTGRTWEDRGASRVI